MLYLAQILEYFLYSILDNSHMQTVLSEQAQRSLKNHFSVDDVDVEWSRPQDSAHGDTATPVCLRIAKELKKNPKEVAEVVAKDLAELDSVEKAEVAGAGYVNVWLTPQALLEELKETDRACRPQDVRKEAPVVIDYSGPNIAKPLGIHHILSTVIGQSLVNLHRHLGYETIGINHLGDWGTQFGKLSVALQKWGERSLDECSIEDLFALYVRFHEEAEKDSSLEDEAREAFKKIEENDPELRGFWEEVVRITMEALNHLYVRLQVSFDHIHGESFYEGKMQPIVDEGKKKGVFTEGREGALIAEFPEEKNLSPAIVMKADDATIYLTRDLATARYRIDSFDPQAILYVVDVAQQYYFQQLFASLELLEWELPHMEHVVFGRMSFKDKNMSTRKGNILRLEEVLDEAVARAQKAIEEHGDSIQTEDPEELSEMMGVGAVVYGVLSQNRKMDITFDWEKVLSFDGNSAPYLQYTHARAKSVLRKAEEEGYSMEPGGISSLSEKERALLTLLLEFPNVLNEAKESLMPHILTNYLFSLSQAFNTFYNAEPILKASESDRALRLTLTSTTAAVLKAGAEILTIRVSDRM